MQLFSCGKNVTCTADKTVLRSNFIERAKVKWWWPLAKHEKTKCFYLQNDFYYNSISRTSYVKVVVLLIKLAKLKFVFWDLRNNKNGHSFINCKMSFSKTVVFIRSIKTNFYVFCYFNFYFPFTLTFQMIKFLQFSFQVNTN